MQATTTDARLLASMQWVHREMGRKWLECAPPPPPFAPSLSILAGDENNNNNNGGSSSGGIRARPHGAAAQVAIPFFREPTSTSAVVVPVPFGKPEVGSIRCANFVEMHVRLLVASECGGPGMGIFFYLPRGVDPGAVPEGEVVDPEGAISIFGSGNNAAAVSAASASTGGWSMVAPSRPTLGSVFECGCVLRMRESAGDQTSYYIPAGRVRPPFFLRDAAFESITVSYGYKDGEDVCYHISPPSFENICGGVSMVNSSHIQEAVAALEARGGGFSPLKKATTAFGVCHELFTVFGNVALRTDKNLGGTVSFKGTRDVSKIFGIIRQTLGSEFLECCLKYKNEQRHASSSKHGFLPAALSATAVAVAIPPDDVGGSTTKDAGVSVSVSEVSGGGRVGGVGRGGNSGWSSGTSSGIRKKKRFAQSRGSRRYRRAALGAIAVPSVAAPVAPQFAQRITVQRASCEYDSLYSGLFGVHMAVVTACLGKRLSVYQGNALENTLQRVLGDSGVSIVDTMDDDNNAIRMRILDWAGVVSRAKESFEYVHGARAAETLAWRAPSCVDENTTTVTGKGSVIIRFSWDVALPWTEAVSGEILEACGHLCALLRECC